MSDCTTYLFGDAGLDPFLDAGLPCYENLTAQPDGTIRFDILAEPTSATLKAIAWCVHRWNGRDFVQIYPAEGTDPSTNMAGIYKFETDNVREYRLDTYPIGARFTRGTYRLDFWLDGVRLPKRTFTVVHDFQNPAHFDSQFRDPLYPPMVSYPGPAEGTPTVDGNIYVLAARNAALDALTHEAGAAAAQTAAEAAQTAAEEASGAAEAMSSTATTQAGIATTQAGIATAAADAVTGIAVTKVDKVEGKGLSTEDYTSEEKQKLAGLSPVPAVSTVQQLLDGVSDDTIVTPAVLADANYLQLGMPGLFTVQAPAAAAISVAFTSTIGYGTAWNGMYWTGSATSPGVPFVVPGGATYTFAPCNAASCISGAFTAISISSSSLVTAPSVVGCKYLVSLSLNNNQLTTPPVLTGLTSLGALDLRYNQLTTPPVLTGLTSLQSLGLSRNQLTTPPVLTGLTSLGALDLRYNRLTTPPVLTGLTSLQSLDLRYNQLTTPPVLTGLTSLGALYLGYNQLTTPPVLTGLTSLGALYLGYNQLTTPPVLTGLTSLQSLFLDGNQLTTPPVLTGLTSLYSLSLGYNQLTTAPLLTNLSTIRLVDVRSNYLSAAEVDALFNSLPTVPSQSGSVYVNNNGDGSLYCNPAIATGKGWNVYR